METIDVEKTGFSMPEGEMVNSVEDLFRLYSELLQPLRDFERLFDRQESLQRDIQNAKDTIRTALIKSLLLALKYTIILAIPFVIVFLIAANVIHTEEGTALFDVYDAWFGETAFGIWFLGKLSTQGSLLALLLVLIVGCVLFPIVAFLFPALLAVSIIGRVIAVIAARKTIKTGNAELGQLQVQIDNLFSKLAPSLAFVPPDYRYSAAVEHFCQSYYNGRAGTLKEAVNLFDNYVHQLEMEYRQQQIVDSHNEILRKLDAQSAQFNRLERKIGKLQSDVDWLYWK